MNCKANRYIKRPSTINDKPTGQPTTTTNVTTTTKSKHSFIYSISNSASRYNCNFCPLLPKKHKDTCPNARQHKTWKHFSYSNPQLHYRNSISKQILMYVGTGTSAVTCNVQRVCIQQTSDCVKINICTQTHTLAYSVTQ